MPEIDPDTPTELLPRARFVEPAPSPAPVFVDAAGRRRRLAHRLATGVFLAAAGYSLMVIWSLLGGPVSPDTLMPFSAPHPAVPPVRPVLPPAGTSAAVAGAVSVSAAASARGATSAAVGSHATASPPTASPTASPSASAAATGHRPTTAPGKPSTSATAEHGH